MHSFHLTKIYASICQQQLSPGGLFAFLIYVKMSCIKMAIRLSLVCQNVLVKTSHIYGKTRITWPSGLKALLLALGCRCPKRHSAEGCQGPPGDGMVCLQEVSILCNLGESFNSFSKGCIFVCLGFFFWIFCFCFVLFFKCKSKIYRNSHKISTYG